MKDSEFMQDAAKLNVEVAPVSGLDIQNLVETTTSIHASLAERAKPFLAD